MRSPETKPGAARPPFAHRNMPLLLLQARESVMAHFRPVLNAHGITEQQWRIVRLLLDSGPMEPRDISRLSGISSPSLVGVMTRMQEMGFITRKRMDQDQRRLMVSLTTRSRALAARMAPEIDATYGRIEKLVGIEHCNRLYELLDLVTAALRTNGTATDED